MNHEQPKELVRSALLCAKKDGHSYSNIARDIGYDARYLYDLVRKNTITYDRARKLEKWLTEHNYLHPSATGESDVWKPIAREVFALGEILLSDYPNKFKADKLITWLKVTTDNINDILAILESRK